MTSTPPHTPWNLTVYRADDLVARIKSPVFDYVLPQKDNIYQFFGTDVTGRIKPSVS